MFKKCLTALLFVLFAIASLQAATVKLSTYAEFNLELLPDDSEKWGISASEGTPKAFVELKFDVSMGKEFSLWMKANADSSGITTLVSTDDYSSLYAAEIHAKYLKNLSGNNGFELLVFVNENSHFYLNQPLLGFTDNGDAWAARSGMYFNGWNVAGFDFMRAFLVGTGISEGEAKQLGAGLRVRKDFLKGGFKVGLTGMHYSDNVSNKDRNYFQEGFDVDTSLLGPFSLVYEMGFVQIPDVDSVPLTFKGELRGNFSLLGGDFGQMGFLAAVTYAGEEYSNWRGNTVDDCGNNRLVERLEFYYNFPLKAIYLKQHLVYSHSLTDGSKSHLWQFEFDSSTDASFDSYSELYIEFLNGFKFKSYYKYTQGADSVLGKIGTWNNVLFQLEVENEFAKIKPMVLMLNVGDEDKSATAYGAEVLINLTDKIKFYSRFAMVAGSTDPAYFNSKTGTQNWGTFFCEIQLLKVFQNTDMYFTYGNGDHTNNDLVHDQYNGILNGYATEKKFNINIKFWL